MAEHGPVELPIPPSANHIWRGTKAGKFYRSARYDGWFDPAVMLLRCGLPKAKGLPARLRIVVTGGNGWRKGRDLDNVLKPLIDAVKVAGIVPDDTTEFIDGYDLSFRPGSKAARAAVRVWLIDNA